MVAGLCTTGPIIQVLGDNKTTFTNSGGINMYNTRHWPSTLDERNG